MNATTATKAPFRVQITSSTPNPAYPHKGSFEAKMRAERRRVRADNITKADHFFDTEDEARAFAAPLIEADAANGRRGLHVVASLIEYAET